MANKRPDISQEKALEQAQEMLGLTDAFRGKDVVKGTGKKKKKKQQLNLKGARGIQREINSVINLSVDAALAAFGGPKSFQRKLTRAVVKHLPKTEIRDPKTNKKLRLPSFEHSYVAKPTEAKTQKKGNLHQAGTAARHEQYLTRDGSLYEQIAKANAKIDCVTAEETTAKVGNPDFQSSGETSVGSPEAAENPGAISTLGDPTAATSASDAERYLARDEAPFKDEAGPISIGNIGDTVAERMEFWNLIEEHSRSNARIQNRLIGEIPHELMRHPQLVRAMMERFAEQFSARNLPFHLVVHKPAPGPGHDQRNIHFHLVYSQRPATRLPSGQWDFAEAETYKRKNRETRTRYPHRQEVHPDTDTRFWVTHLRESYCDIANEFLEKIAADKIYRPSTYTDLGIDVIPQVHLGPAKAARERRGRHTLATNLNNMIQLHNSRNYIDAAIKQDFEPVFEFSRRARKRLQGADKDEVLVRELSDSLDRHNKMATEITIVATEVERINSLTAAINLARVEIEIETKTERQALDRLLKRAETTQNNEIQKSVKKLATRKFKELDVLEKVTLNVDPGSLEKSKELSRLRNRVGDLHIALESEHRRISKLVGMLMIAKKSPLPKVSDQRLDQVLSKLRKTGPDSLNPVEQLAFISGVALRLYKDRKYAGQSTSAGNQNLQHLSRGLKVIADQMAKHRAGAASRQKPLPLDLGIQMALMRISEKETQTNPLFQQILDRAASSNNLITLATFDPDRATASYTKPAQKQLPEEADLVAKNQVYFAYYFDQITRKLARQAELDFRQNQRVRARPQRTR